MLMMVGCGPSWDRFADEYTDGICARETACGWNTYDACTEALMPAVLDDESGYPGPEAGAACLNALDKYADDCSSAASDAIHDACEDAA